MKQQDQVPCEDAMTTKDVPARKPTRERKKNADMRRRQLLDATQRSIVHNGLSKTTLATVANEADLSQGVAVFYYDSKAGLLVAALEDIYAKYEANWRHALRQAGDDPKNRLWALIRADFDEHICNKDSLAVWYAFWGEQKFTPQYSTIAQEFDLNRTRAIQDLCRKLFPDDQADTAEAIAIWIDMLTDGYWQRMHLFPELCTREIAIEGVRAFLARVLPEHFKEWARL